MSSRLKTVSLTQIFAAILILLVALPIQAHFRLNANIRIIHVEHLELGLRVYLRLPTPYVLAQRLGAAQDDGVRAPAPYTYNKMENNTLMHYIDGPSVEQDVLGLGVLIADGHQFLVGNKALPAKVEQVRIHTTQEQPPFATLAEAKAALAASPRKFSDREVFVGDTVTDVQLRYVDQAAFNHYSVSSNLDPKLDDQDKTANLLLDHYPGATQIFRASGLLSDPIVVSRSALAAAWTFILEGVGHILEGYDHVLFVVCLVIGATSMASLLWRVTGFTLGHSVTLIGGFFGLAPSAAWFIPAVETGIALSIIYAAVIALAASEVRSSFLVTALIGLLHGLGFSFLLREIVQINAPNLWQSLVSFNIGVEAGQIAIVLLIWPLIRLLNRINPAWIMPLRWCVALPCIAVADLWSGERIVMFIDALNL